MTKGSTILFLHVRPTFYHINRTFSPILIKFEFDDSMLGLFWQYVGLCIGTIAQHGKPQFYKAQAVCSKRWQKKGGV